MLVEGVRAVAEALDAGAEVVFAVTSPKLCASGAGEALRRRLSASDVEAVSDEELSVVADARTPQGVLLVCRQPRHPLAGLAGRRFLVLDAVQDPGNVGTLIRGAVAFGLDGVICLDGTVDPWGAKAVRASAGLAFRAGLASATADECVTRLAALGVPILVADAGGVDVRGVEGVGAFALVVGNEGAGVRPELRRAAHATVGVRMPGGAESLNAGVAGSILMHSLTGGNGGE